MKKLFIFCIISWGLSQHAVQAQIIDTVIQVNGGHQLHVNIIKGKSAPILFESGWGNGGDVWNSITKQIADVTGATIITYDRLSQVADKQAYEIGIENEIIALEDALKKLGYSNKKLMLVAHSLGGMYGSYYAARHPDDVKAAVFIDDANACSLDFYLSLINSDTRGGFENYLAHIVNAVEKKPMPENIPLIDIVAESDSHEAPDSAWLSCHKSFVAQAPARNLFLAHNVGHSIFTDNPPLVINIIIAQYASFVEPEQKPAILEKGLALSTEMINDSKPGHSADELITWGYALLEKGETEKAIEIFKLNVFLNPDGWNNYDSLGEAYLEAGNKLLAIENYKKSLELNPQNDNAIKVLEQIK